MATILLPQPGDRVNFHHKKAGQIMRGVFIGVEEHPHARLGTKKFAAIQVENQPYYKRGGISGKVGVLCGFDDIQTIIKKSA